MINSRLITDLIPVAQKKYWEFDSEMKKAGITYLVTSTLRDDECQEFIYSKGRTRPGNIVTWTKESKHKEGIAWDIVIMNNNTPSWDIKVDVNNNMVPDYIEVANIGRKIGLICGADFKDKSGKSRPDWPHLQLKEQNV
jgi:peptidoglycan LD-endopeptidase CwlK